MSGYGMLGMVFEIRSREAFVIFMRMAYCAEPETGIFEKAPAEMAVDCDVHLNAISRSIAYLLKMGAIHRVDSRENAYLLDKKFFKCSDGSPGAQFGIESAFEDESRSAS